MKNQAEGNRKTYTVDEFAKIVGLGKNAAYAAVHRKEIASIRFGGKILIPRVALEKILATE